MTESQIDDFRYQLSDEEESVIRSTIKVWTEEELLYSISAGLLKEVTDTQATIEEPNIVGNNITIVSYGTIGSFDAPIYIDLTRPNFKYTVEERIALAAAERTDVVFVAGKQLTGNFTFTPNTSTGDTIKRLDTGSFVTDNYKVGMYVRVQSTVNAVSQGTYWQIKNVTSSTLTLSAKGAWATTITGAATVTQVALDPQQSLTPLTGIEIAQRQDVDLTTSGNLDVTAGGNVFIGSESNLSIKSITTAGLLTLKTAGEITNGAADSAATIMNTGSMVLEASGGTIGTALKTDRDRPSTLRHPDDPLQRFHLCHRDSR